MSLSDQSILEENKREMFDGMRAYHESENKHKADAILMLTAMLAATGGVFAAILAPGFQAESATTVAALLAIAATIGVVWVVLSTNEKIDADHSRYAEFGAEYVQTCKLLGLYSPITSGSHTATLKENERIGQGVGYKKTKAVLNGFGTFIVLIAWVAFFYVNSHSKAASAHPDAGACRPALAASK